MQNAKCKINDSDKPKNKEIFTGYLETVKEQYFRLKMKDKFYATLLW